MRRTWKRSFRLASMMKGWRFVPRTGIVNFFVEKQMIDELKRGKGVESNERLGIRSW